MGKAQGWRSGLSGAARDPVVWIFVLAGGLEVFTGDFALHATLLVVVAAVLVAGGVRGWAGGPRARMADDEPAAGCPLSDQQNLTPALVAPFPGRRPRAISAVALVGGLAYVVAVGSLRRYSPPATVSITIPALAALVWAWRVPGRLPQPEPLGRLGAAVWLSLFGAFGIWELVSLAFQPTLRFSSKTHPTFSRLLDPAFAHPAGRMVGLAVWLAVGWFLLERA